jgi:hypothetical protein
VRAATQWSRADPDGSGSSAAGQLHDGQLALRVPTVSCGWSLQDAAAIEPASTTIVSISARMFLLTR